MHFSLPLGVAAPFAKDSPLFELFKEELSKMRESGQIGQVNTKYSVQKEGVKCSDGKVCTYAKSKGLFFTHWFFMAPAKCKISIYIRTCCKYV